MALVEGCKHEVEITVTPEEVEGATLHVVQSVQKRAKIPGFRPGKVPLTIIRSKFRDEIRQDVLEHVMPAAFRKRADEEHWKVVGNPAVVDVHFVEGEPLRFKAEFEVAPEFELGEYRGLEVPYAQPEVTEEDVEKRIEELRDRKAEFVNEDPRPLADGDYAQVSLTSVAGVEGEPIKSENMTLHIGDADTLPEFSEALRGVTPGETKTVAVAYPEDYGQDRLAGKTVTFAVTVNMLRRRELPEINDEFARDLGDYQTLEELRNALRNSIRAEREYTAQSEAKTKLVDQLADRHDFPIPNAYLDRQIESQVERRLRDLAAQGIDPKQLKLDWDKIKESQKDSAARDVRASLLLERIGEVESIHVTNEEVDREVQRIAKQEREPVAATRMRLEKDGTLARIAGGIRTQKVLAFLFENASKVTPPPSADPVVSDSASVNPE